MGKLVKNTLLHMNNFNSNFEYSFTLNCNITQTGQIGTFSFLPTIIIPLYKGKNSCSKVRTLLDSGAGHSWITKAILQHINHTWMPTQKLTIGTLSGTARRKCKMVQVYFKQRP